MAAVLAPAATATGDVGVECPPAMPRGSVCFPRGLQQAQSPQFTEQIYQFTLMAPPTAEEGRAAMPPRKRYPRC